jgi:hypothetical protein
MPSDTPASSAKPLGQSPSATPKGGTLGKGILVAAVVAAGVHAAGVFGTEDRYPLRVEYELAKACIDGGGARLSHAAYLAKQEQCLCTLEATMKKVPFDKYKKSAAEFVSSFRTIAPTCADKGRS